MLINPEVLKRVVKFLAKSRIPYMAIGGLANSIWGEPRLTRDADFKVSIDMPLTEFRKKVLTFFEERPTKIPQAALSPYVVHIWAIPEVAVDLLVSVFDYEKQAIERAVEWNIEGVSVRVCRAEDFIVHKVVANREYDWLDIERVLIRQKSKLDQSYILDWLTQFSEALENPEMLARYKKLRAQYDPKE
jgi:predicted nucleotidyltransferase